MPDTFELPAASELLALFVRLFACLCLVAGLVVFAVAGLAYWRARPFVNGDSMTALVVDNRPVEVQGKTNYRPIVEFEVAGAVYQVEATIAESERLPDGSELQVSYQQGEPELARVAAPGVQVMRTAAISGGIGAAIGAALLSPIVSRRLTPSTKRDLPGQSNGQSKESDEI